VAVAERRLNTFDMFKEIASCAEGEHVLMASQQMRGRNSLVAVAEMRLNTFELCTEIASCATVMSESC